MQIPRVLPLDTPPQYIPLGPSTDRLPHSRCTQDVVQRNPIHIPFSVNEYPYPAAIHNIISSLNNWSLCSAHCLSGCNSVFPHHFLIRMKPKAQSRGGGRCKIMFCNFCPKLQNKYSASFAPFHQYGSINLLGHATNMKLNLRSVC